MLLLGCLNGEGVKVKCRGNEIGPALAENENNDTRSTSLTMRVNEITNATQDAGTEA